MALDNSLVNRNWRGAAPGAGGFREPPAGNADSYGGWGAQANPALVAQQDEAAQRTDNVRGTGTLTHFRPVAHGGADWTVPQGGTRAPAPGGGAPGGFKDPSLGEPTSYAGGVGAPTPIENMGKGFVNPGGGPAYATAQEAGQAANRAAGVGTWRPSGQTLEEVKGAAHTEAMAAYSRDPSKVTQANIAEQKQADAVKAKVGTDFEGRALKRYGVYKGGKLERPAEEHVLRDLDEAKEYAMEKGDPQAGHQYMEWSQRLREMYPDVYATTMRANPLAWRDIVVTHGPQIPAARTTAPAAPAFTEPQGVTGGLSPFSVGP